ncbi:hypothetical protein GRF59_04185 [Paenibacillus sp. HJL G12]|uniref:Uncharacterized protein n=1 Tax=Paenibacillus dendrobii TaxID=2691084 RepID=A0A7X3LGS9_9BACL|nr:hypothetical protein [Paenibacillus dendrobii]MWV42818.1 hypothetical protein [Paenibacillus dendrobii]
MEEKQNNFLTILIILLIVYLLYMAFGRVMDGAVHAGEHWFGFIRNAFSRILN